MVGTGDKCQISARGSSDRILRPRPQRWAFSWTRSRSFRFAGQVHMQLPGWNHGAGAAAP